MRCEMMINHVYKSLFFITVVVVLYATNASGLQLTLTSELNFLANDQHCDDLQGLIQDITQSTEGLKVNDQKILQDLGICYKMVEGVASESIYQSCERQINQLLPNDSFYANTHRYLAKKIINMIFLQSAESCKCLESKEYLNFINSGLFPTATTILKHVCINHSDQSSLKILHYDSIINQHLRRAAASTPPVSGDLCLTKMTSKCTSLKIYLDYATCLFNNLDQLKSVCDESVVGGYLSSLYSYCDKDLLSGTCLPTVPSNSFDTIMCLKKNYATISPLCRVRIEALGTDQGPCVSDSKKYCSNKAYQPDLFECLGDIDESNVSQDCLAVIEGYDRCKYPTTYDDDDTVAEGEDDEVEEDDTGNPDDATDPTNNNQDTPIDTSQNSNIVDDDDSKDDKTPKLMSRRSLTGRRGIYNRRQLTSPLDTIKTCWAKIHTVNDDDDDEAPEEDTHLGSTEADDDDDTDDENGTSQSTVDNKSHKSDKVIKRLTKPPKDTSRVPFSVIVIVFFVSIGAAVGTVYAVRSWRMRNDGRGRYVKASVVDVDVNEDNNASEEIIQSRLMDVDEKGSKTTSIAMRRLDSGSAAGGAYSFDNPFAAKRKSFTENTQSTGISRYDEPNLDYDSEDEETSLNRHSEYQQI